MSEEENMPSEDILYGVSISDSLGDVEHIVLRHDDRRDPDYVRPVFGMAGEERRFLRERGWRPFWHWYFKWHRARYDEDEELKARGHVSFEFGFRWRPDGDSFYSRHTRERRHDAVKIILDNEEYAAHQAYRKRLREVDPEAYDSVYSNFIEWGGFVMADWRGCYGSTGL